MVKICISEEEIINGSNCMFRAGTNSDDIFDVGIIRQFSVKKTTQESEAYVLGNIYPITKDKNEIMCLIMINGIIPNKLLLPKPNVSKINYIEIEHIIPNLIKLLNISNNILNYVDFYNNKEDKKIASFYNVSIINNGQYLMGLSKLY